MGRRRELDHDHRDVPRQKELPRVTFAGMHPDADRWLDELEHRRDRTGAEPGQPVHVLNIASHSSTSTELNRRRRIERPPAQARTAIVMPP